MYFHVFLGAFRHVAQRRFLQQKSLETLTHQGFQGFSVGALQGIRTPDLLVRSQTLYPAELAAQIGLKAFAFSPPKYNSTESKKSQHVFVIFLSPVHIGK